jgi:hypothetical protein
VAEDRWRQRPDGLDIEGFDIDPIEAATARDVGEDEIRRSLQPGFIGSIGHDQHQATAVVGPGHERKQVQTGWIRPLDILDDEDGGCRLTEPLGDPADQFEQSQGADQGCR